MNSTGKRRNKFEAKRRNKFEKNERNKPTGISNTIQRHQRRIKAMNRKERKALQYLFDNLKGLQNRVVFGSTTEAQAKQWRIQALGDTMETLDKLLGEK